MFASQQHYLLGPLLQVNHSETIRTAVGNSQVCWCCLTGLMPLHLLVWHIWTVESPPAVARGHQQVPQADQQTKLRLLRITGRLTQQYHQTSLLASSRPRFHSKVCQHPTAYTSLHLSSVYKSRALEEAAEGQEAASNNANPRIPLNTGLCESALIVSWRA